MKKRILSVIVIVLILSSCLCINVSAGYKDVTIINGGENLQYKYKDNIYNRFDASFVYFESEDYLEDVTYDAVDTNSSNYICSASYEISKYDAMITAYFIYRDGSKLTATFINQNYYNEYISFCENADTYSIEFFYPNQTTVTTNREALLGKKVTIDDNQLAFCDEFGVESKSPDGVYSIYQGSLLIINDDYYYVDYKENNITSPHEFDLYEMSSLEAYIITDEDLCEQIRDARGDNIDIFGIGLFGDILTIFVFFIFAIIPLAILILFIILYVRAKTPAYKKLFFSIWITSAIELITFISITILLLVYK